MPGVEEFDVVIVGAGPAGMAAAWAATRRRGCRVAVLDDNPAAGGQIWRGGSGAGSVWFERFAACGATLVAGRRVVAGRADERTLVTDAGRIRFSQLILATGARELFLPFPGWTLPGVMGAGGLQAMVKGGLPVRGRRVVVAGSGPLLLAVAASLAVDAGAEVAVIAEQSPARRVRSFGTRLWRDPGKLAQALALRWSLRGTPYRTDAWPVRAIGERSVLAAVDLLVEGTVHRVECDYLACGFGLIPNSELAALLDCALDARGFVRVDSHQQTSQPGVFCAGEPTGVGGVELALIEGQIAGCAASGEAPGAKLLEEQAKLSRWRAALEEAFSLRPELARLAAEDTVVCRCEEVRFGELAAHHSWRTAKLQTRCGMGPCQGRVCGPAVERLFGWRGAASSIRPPVFPATAAALSRFLPNCDNHVTNK